MPVHRETRLLPHSCTQLFQLVLDIERYPEFVPGYLWAQVIQRSDTGMEVEQTVGIGAATVSFRSHAEFTEGRTTVIRAEEEPFRRLVVEWRFAPQEDGCRVEFGVDYQLHGPLAPLLAHWLVWVAPCLLDAFVRRARYLPLNGGA